MAEHPADPRIAPDLRSLLRLEHQARGFSFLYRQPIQSLLSGRRAGRMRGRGLDFEEIRAYRPGDAIRSIDWRASARTGHTQTRVFTEERDRTMLLVVDLTAAMFFGSIYATKSAIAAEITSLAAWRGLRGGDRVGALLFGDDGTELLRSHRSRGAVSRILGAVARRAAALAAGRPGATGPGPLNAALRQAEGLAGHDWLVIVIADLQAGDAESAAILGRIGRHNDVVAVPISDPLERALPPRPWKGGLATDGTRIAAFEPQRDGQRIAEDYASRLERIRRGGIRLGTPVLPVGTEAAAAPQLRRLLGRAASLRRR